MATLFSAGARYAVATPHHKATQAGRDVFARGGNAIDAAVTAAAVLTVAYPHQCSIGGDLFALVRNPQGDVVAVNGSGAAAAAVNVDTLSASYTTMPPYGPHTITVPGAVAGWESIAAMGASLSWQNLLAPAIDCAAHGVRVTPSLARALHADVHRLTADPGLTSILFSNGVPLRTDDIMLQPNLARSMTVIANEGAAALYGGPMGTTLVKNLREMGSKLTIEDFAAHKTELTSPLRTVHDDWELMTTGPNSQGFVLPEILSAISELSIDPNPLGPDAAALAGIYRLASRDRDRWLADPRRSNVPIDQLLDRQHVRSLGERALLPWRGPSARPAARVSGDTVALVTADSDGWAVCLIQSVFHSFGSGILEPATGIVLHNRGTSFSLDPRHPNVIEGGKRPAHTLMPVMILARDRPAAIAGTMGGRAQPQIHAQVLPRVMGSEGLAPAVEAPRWIVGRLDDGANPEAILVEGRAHKALERLGMLNAPIHRLEDWDEDAGHYSVIRVLPDGGFEAMSDPRSDGGSATGDR